MSMLFVPATSPVCLNKSFKLTLPFDSPDEIMNRAYNSLLKRQGKNPFYQSELPKATMRLRQGIGRLIRTETDTGVAVILDPRLLTRRYGQTIMKNLERDYPLTILPTDQLVRTANNFLKKHH